MTSEEKPESIVLSAEEIANLKPVSMQVEPIGFDKLLGNLRQMGSDLTNAEPWVFPVWRLAEEIQAIKERLDS